MFRWTSCLTLIAVVCCASPSWSADVEFPDANLDTVIREILKKKQIDKTDKAKKITDEDLATDAGQEAAQQEQQDRLAHRAVPDRRERTARRISSP